MANKKISALDAVASVAGTNEFAVNEAGTTKKATAAQIKTYVNTADYSLSEQVWPFATWFGAVIYWRTWAMADGANNWQTLTGLPSATTGSYVFAQKIATNLTTSIGRTPETIYVGYNTPDFRVFLLSGDTDIYITVWYTKA